MGAILLVAPGIHADTSVAALNTSATTNVIVQYASEPDQQQESRMAALGAVRRKYMPFVGAAVYEVPRDKIASLAKDRSVLSVSPDRPVAGFMDSAIPSIRADFALTGARDGQGVGIAVIDSGINVTGDMMKGSRSRVVYSANFSGSGTTADGFGHGTHVASIIAGDGTMSSGPNFYRSFRGVAPGANILSFRVLDDNGMGTESSVIQAINQAILLKNLFNIRVINLSLGRPVFESYLSIPFARRWKKRGTPASSWWWRPAMRGRNQTQGTNGYATIMAPANDPLVITVGAMKDDDQRFSRTTTLSRATVRKAPRNRSCGETRHSSRRVIALFHCGLKNATVATKSSVVNQVPQNYYRRRRARHLRADYYRLSGTSMSAAPW